MTGNTKIGNNQGATVPMKENYFVVKNIAPNRNLVEIGTPSWFGSLAQYAVKGKVPKFLGQVGRTKQQSIRISSDKVPNEKVMLSVGGDDKPNPSQRVELLS